MAVPYLIKEPPKSAFTARVRTPYTATREVQLQQPTAGEPVQSEQQNALTQVDSNIAAWQARKARLEQQLETVQDPRVRGDILLNIRETERLIDTNQKVRNEILAGNIPIDVQQAVQQQFESREKGLKQLKTQEQLKQDLSQIKTLEEYKTYYKGLSGYEKKFLESPSSIESRETARQAALERVGIAEKISITRIPQEKISATGQARVGETLIPQETLQGTLYQKQVGTFRGVPQYEIIYRSPLGEERLATPSEQQEFLAAPELHKEVASGGVIVAKPVSVKDLIFGNILEIAGERIVPEERITTPEGTISRGGITPITPEDIFVLTGGAIGLAKAGTVTAGKIIFAEPITKLAGRIIDYAIPPAQTGFAKEGLPSQVGRGVLFLASTPLTGTSYAFELAKSGLLSPVETAKGFGKFAIESPYEFGIVSGYGIAKTGIETTRFVRARISPRYSPIETTKFGEQIIKDVEILPAQKIDIGLIPERGAKLAVDVSRILKETEIPYKKAPIIPKVPREFEAVLAGAKETKAIISGSFAQKVLLEEKYTRPFKDIDVLSTNIGKTTEAIKARDINLASEKKLITDSPLGEFEIQRIKFKGKQIADIDPLAFAEEGLIKKYGLLEGIEEFEGTYFVSPKIRLAAKAQQFARGKATEKVLKDIQLLTKGEFDLKRPTIKGAYGFTKEELAEYIGKTGTITTSARDLFKILEKDTKIKTKLYGTKEYGLFATPFEIKTGMAQTRITRLGVETKPATIKDLISGNVVLKGEKPQIVLFPEQKIGETFKVPFKSSELEVEARAGFPRGYKVGVTIISGKPVEIYSARFVKASEANLGKLAGLKASIKSFLAEKKAEAGGRIKEIDISPQTGKPYFSPYYLLTSGRKLIASEERTSQKEIEIIISRDIITKEIPSQNKVKSIISSSLKVPTTPSVPSYREPSVPSVTTSIYEEPSIPSYPIKYKETSIPSYPTRRYTPPTTIVSTIKKVAVKYPERKRRRVPAYSVLIRRKGKFIPIATGLPRGRAFRVLEKGLFQSIARTGKLVESGTTEVEEEGFKPSPIVFREFKVRGGKRIETPDQFVQRAAYNLQTSTEKFELAQARILKQAGL